MTTPRVFRVLLVAFLVATVVVAVSGILLSFAYLPHAARDSGLSDTLRPVHEISADILLGAAVLLVVVAVIRAVAQGTPTAVIVVSGSLLALVGIGVAIARGTRLAWDQLALWAVTVGNTNLEGVWLRDNVKYVLRGPNEISTGEYQRAVWIHVLVAPLITAVGIAVVLLAMRSRREPAQPEASGSATKFTSASS